MMEYRACILTVLFVTIEVSLASRQAQVISQMKHTAIDNNGGVVAEPRKVLADRKALEDTSIGPGSKREPQGTSKGRHTPHLVYEMPNRGRVLHESDEDDTWELHESSESVEKRDKHAIGWSRTEQENRRYDRHGASAKERQQLDHQRGRFQDKPRAHHGWHSSWQHSAHPRAAFSKKQAGPVWVEGYDGLVMEKRVNLEEPGMNRRLRLPMVKKAMRLPMVRKKAMLLHMVKKGMRLPLVRKKAMRLPMIKKGMRLPLVRKKAMRLPMVRKKALRLPMVKKGMRLPLVRKKAMRLPMVKKKDRVREKQSDSLRLAMIKSKRFWE